MHLSLELTQAHYT